LAPEFDALFSVFASYDALGNDWQPSLSDRALLRGVEHVVTLVC